MMQPNQESCGRAKIRYKNAMNYQQVAWYRDHNMNAAKSVPQVNGFDLRVVPLLGPAGEFDIAFAGGRKDGDLGFFYRDSRAQFFFYAEFHITAPQSWNVFRAMTGAWSGVPVRMTAQDAAAVQQNIEFFFKTRLADDPGKAGDDTTAAWPVTFSWKVVK